MDRRGKLQESVRGNFEAQRELHDRLRGARSRALRAANVATATRILEIGCGYAFTLPEWVARTHATVTSIDVDPPEEAIRPAGLAADRVRVVRADARQLPFDDRSFDLIFVQCVLMWLNTPDRGSAIHEAARTLLPGGYLVAIEPDYRSLAVEPDPHDLYGLAESLLIRAGADTIAGRTLPGMFAGAGFESRSLLFDRVEPASPNAAAILFDLARTDGERRRLETIQRWIAAERPTLHLPFWSVVGRKRGEPDRDSSPVT